MNTLTFEKISKLDRNEPVAFGVPFAQGELADPAAFRLLDGGRVVPAQVRVTGTWPDGSARWLFVRALVDLPGNAAKQMSFATDASLPAAGPVARVRLSRREDGSIAVDTGPLALTIPARGIRPVRDVRLAGRPLWAADPFRGIRVNFGGRAHSTADLPVRLAVEQDGPLCAVVRIEADAPADADAEPAVAGRLTFWAGRADVVFAYTMTHRGARLGTFTEVRDWTMDLSPAGGKPLLRVCTRGDYRDRVERSDGPLAFRVTADWLRRNSCEHQIDCFHSNLWADWQGPAGGVMASVRHAAQNFPKGFSLSADRFAVQLYPAEEPDALQWFAGTAKTHEILLHFHGPDASDAELGCRSAQFQLPDRPAVSPQRYGRSGVWPERIFEGPTCRRLINFFAKIADMRPTGMGIFNFGDEPDAGYTRQGRGEAGADEGDRQVWLNNEYDLVHHLYVFAARTGERRFLEYAANAARHWMDVDIVHGGAEPRTAGGHLAHCRRHAAEPSVYPSHQWVAGLFDTYHLTGDPDALAAAMGVANNIAWQVENLGYLAPGTTSTREMGWALRAMTTTWRETHEPRWLELCRRVEALFVEWAGEGGRLTGRMLAPYTVHGEPRVNFMNALTGVSLGQYHLATGSETAKRLVVAIADDLLANGLNAWGLPYYKELPSLKRTTAGIMVLELLVYAFRLTGRRHYIEAALPTLEESLHTEGYHLGALIKRPMVNGIFTENVSEPKGGKAFATSMAPTLELIAIAGGERLARELDYRLSL